MDITSSHERSAKWTRSGSLSLHEPRSLKRMRSSSLVGEPLDQSSSLQSQRRTRYDLTGTMNRLRSSMVGQRRLSRTQLDTMDKEAQRDEEGEPTVPVVFTFDNDDDNNDNISPQQKSALHCISHAAGQIPAVILIGMFHLMIGIPFGVSYFPIGWSSTSYLGDDNGDATDDDAHVNGEFPLPGKEALGIRMFLFSTIVGQVVFTLASGFKNPIGLQMVENVPFCHELSAIVISHQGYGMDALSTIFLMFGLASIIVGAVFYVLGRFRLGRVVYYFPTHVLVGCIGGIGLYIAKTGVEVTINAPFSATAVWKSMHLLGVVILFEVVLRFLEHMTRDANGKQRYSLLSPIYFCLITPVFYAALWLFHVDLSDAEDAGYFFPSLDNDEDNSSSSTSFLDSTFKNGDLFEIWRIIDFSTVSWRAIVDSIPTLVALTLFSLIHVPINIPAFAISTNTEADMNRELVAHGYSNVMAGAFGGLQNYMAYTQSVLYDKSGGTGKASGMAVAAVTSALFVIGPEIASHIPRCMAGTLLLHVGIDLFLEGVYDSYGKFDNLEYAGIWLITIVMTIYGMDAAMIAGVVTAISTYVVQNVTYVNPVRGYMSASTLRSSEWNRNSKARAILDDPYTGRRRILIFQLQGHLFFGSIAHLTETIKEVLSEKFGTADQPLIVILDFSLVLGIDSSAAQSMAKLKKVMQKQFNVEICIFVSGSEDGFPCEFNLSQELSAPNIPTNSPCNDVSEPDETTGLLNTPRVSSHDALSKLTSTGSHVCNTLDLALIFSENALIGRVDPHLLDDDRRVCETSLRKDSSLSEERDVAIWYLENLSGRTVEKQNVELLFSKFTRESYLRNDVLWKQGSPSDSVKLLVRGTLIATLENEAGTSETIASGNTIGEIGLVEGLPRMSSVQCLSEDAVLYSLSRGSYEQLERKYPRASRLIDLICIRYLSARVQHVSNRIFETRCLPI